MDRLSFHMYNVILQSTAAQDGSPTEWYSGFCRTPKFHPLRLLALMAEPCLYSSPLTKVFEKNIEAL